MSDKALGPRRAGALALFSSADTLEHHCSLAFTSKIHLCINTQVYLTSTRSLLQKIKLLPVRFTCALVFQKLVDFGTAYAGRAGVKINLFVNLCDRLVKTLCGVRRRYCFSALSFETL